MRQYENVVKKYHPGFTHDRDHITKINDIFKHMQHQGQETSPRTLPKNTQNQRLVNSPVYHFKDHDDKKEEKKDIKKEELLKV